MCDNKEKNLSKEELEKVNGGSILDFLRGNDSPDLTPVATVVDTKPTGGETYLK